MLRRFLTFALLGILLTTLWSAAAFPAPARSTEPQQPQMDARLESSFIGPQKIQITPVVTHEPLNSTSGGTTISRSHSQDTSLSSPSRQFTKVRVLRI